MNTYATPSKSPQKSPAFQAKGTSPTSNPPIQRQEDLETNGRSWGSMTGNVLEKVGSSSAELNNNATMQLKAERPLLQRKQETGDRQAATEIVTNRTGLPDRLKTGVENLSGYSLNDVKVHYNSPKPAELQALAYTQGTNIHIAPGQEQHLPHEAWHVVQQRQGKVKPTMQMKGVQINDNEGLEREADLMGVRALRTDQAMPMQAKPSFWGLSHQLAAEFQAVQLRGERNQTSLPDNLKAGVENLSRYSLTEQGILQGKFSVVQRVKIKGEVKGARFLAANMGRDHYSEKVAIIEGLGDEDFETIELLTERVNALLPAPVAAVPSAEMAEMAPPKAAASAEAPSWRIKAPKARVEEALFKALGEFTIDKDRYEIEAHKHKTESTFHLKYDCQAKFVNLFYELDGTPSQTDPSDRVCRDLKVSKGKASKLIKHANAIAKNYLDAIKAALQIV